MHVKSEFLVGSPAGNFANRQLARLDVNRALNGEAPHLIDEWQEVPAIWDAVRTSVDERTESGRYQDYDGDDFDAVIQTLDNGWSAFEIKLDPGQVDEAAMSLVRIASKFKHNPPTSLGVIVGKSGIAYRRKEDGVYVVPITALRA